MVLGGLWERWRDKATREITRSFAIVTVPANDQLKLLHERMPLIFAELHWGRWLGETKEDPRAAAANLSPGTELWPVSSRVNSVKNNDDTLLEPIPADSVVA